MKLFRWHNILIHGGGISSGEKWTFGIIIVAVYVLVLWFDPA